MDMHLALDIWWLVAAMLVFLMQAGFLLLETGLIQERHQSGIAIKNVMMLLASTAAFTLFGYAEMWKHVSDWYVDHGTWRFYQTGFAAVAATIVSGAIAGRTRLVANILIAALVAGIIFPIHGRWVWGAGWLDQLGVHDFAGAGAVHVLGGLVALFAALIAGPRDDKSELRAAGQMHVGPRALPVAACGVLFLWIGWMGFNGGSVVTAAGFADVGDLVLSTCLAASGGGFAVMLLAGYLRWRTNRGYPFAPYAALSGAMAGMVANSACCDLIAASDLSLSLYVGGVAGLFYYGFNAFLQPHIIDDPVEAVGVHVGGGCVGLAAAGFLRLPGYSWGDWYTYFFPQIVDLGALVGWVSLVSIPALVLLRMTNLLVSSSHEQATGLAFEDTTLVTPSPPVHIHYLPDDLRRQFMDIVALICSIPIHLAESLRRPAHEVETLLEDNAKHLDEQAQSAFNLLRRKIRSLLLRTQSTSDVLRAFASNESSPVPAIRIARAVVDDYRDQFGSIITIIDDFKDSDLNETVRGDPSLTGEAIRNLVSNAVYSCLERKERRPKEGWKAVVRVWAECSGAKVQLYVSDNGMGISDEEKRYLGRPFRTWRQVIRGSGLGLFFAGSLFQIHRGELHLSPQPRWEGTTEFRVVLSKWPKFH